MKRLAAGLVVTLLALFLTASVGLADIAGPIWPSIQSTSHSFHGK